MIALVARFVEFLREARARGRAVGAFTCYDLWQLEGVLAGASSVGAPVIVLASSSLFVTDRCRATIGAFRAYLGASRARAVLQADHLTSLEQVETAWQCGIEAVLADGSHLPGPENASFTRRARKSAPNEIKASVAIEAELGRIDGDEDRASASLHGALTEADEVPGFVRESGIDCLAVSVGNVHGHYHGPPSLDWDLLSTLHNASPVPLALHGASGLSDDELRQSIAHGIAKVNFNTELRGQYFETAQAMLPRHRETLDVRSLGEEITGATSTLVASKLQVLGWTG